MGKRKKKIATAGIFLALALVAAYGLFGWKYRIVRKIERLELPAGCETVYPTQVHLSDVYWLHVKGEKVIKCGLGYEAAKEYIEAHNAPSLLKDIDIYEYAGMSDIAIYDSEFDKDFWKQPDRDYYIKISYFRKLSE